MRGGLQSNDAIVESAVEDPPITETTYSPDLTSTLASTLVKWELSKYKNYKILWSKFQVVKYENYSAKWV